VISSKKFPVISHFFLIQSTVLTFLVTNSGRVKTLLAELLKENLKIQKEKHFKECKECKFTCKECKLYGYSIIESS